MPQHVPHPHSPMEMRGLSNIGHGVEGAIISGASMLMLLGAMSEDARLEKISANLLVAGGGLLGVGLVAGSFEHGGPKTFFKADLQQRQHLKMSAALATGGVARHFGKIGRLLSNLSTARSGRCF